MIHVHVHYVHIGAAAGSLFFAVDWLLAEIKETALRNRTRVACTAVVVRGGTKGINGAERPRLV